MTDLYTIQHKDTKLWFNGFDANYNTLWTDNRSKAWRDTKLMADLQAMALERFDEPRLEVRQ